MLKKIGYILILLSISLPGLANVRVNSTDLGLYDIDIDTTEQSISYFGAAQYLVHDEELSLEIVRKKSPAEWEDINIESINLGFDQRHFWFKVPLKNLRNSSTPWILQSDYPLLDHLDIYLLAGNEVVQEFHSGDIFSFNQRPIKQPNFAFPLLLTSEQEYSLYLHIQTSSSLQLALSLQTESNFWQGLATKNAISAAFYSVLISMLLYNLVIFFIVRARSYLFYVLYLSSFILFMVSIHGWGYQFLWPNSPRIHELSVVFLIGPVILFGALFSSNFLKLATTQPALNRLVLSFAWIAASYSIATLIVPYSIMIQIGAALALLAAAVALLSTLQEWLRAKRREVLLFIIAWSTVLIGFFLYSGQKFGLLPINVLTEHAIEMGAVLEVILLALGLADRINSERKSRLETQEQMLEVQIKANKELDKKVRERTEELELLNDHLQIASITDSLTQVKNRYYFDKKLPSEYRRAYRDKYAISLLIIDIDHFKSFNDNYGHQTGDVVLQIVAKSIQDVVKRPSDAVTRYGGEEFTVLLPNTPKEGAYKVAEKIRKKIAELHINWQQQSLSVTASIGLACCIPSHHEGEGLLLKEADDYLYVAKDHGRNQVVYADNDPSMSINNDPISRDI